MPEFIVEQYELHVQQYTIEAADRADAIIGVMRGEGTMVENGCEFVESAERYHRELVELNEDERKKLYEHFGSHTVVDTVRAVEEV